MDLWLGPGLDPSPLDFGFHRDIILDLSGDKRQFRVFQATHGPWNESAMTSGVAGIYLDVDQAHEFLSELSPPPVLQSAFMDFTEIPNFIPPGPRLPFPDLRHLVVRGLEHIQQLPVYSATTQWAATHSLLLSFVEALQKRYHNVNGPAPVLHSLTFVGCGPPPGLDPRFIERALLDSLKNVTRQLTWKENKATWYYSLGLGPPEEDSCEICLSERGLSQGQE